MSDRQDDRQAAVQPPSGDVEPVDPFEWLRTHPWPRRRPAGPRPVLSPEEHTEVTLSPEDRQRRAVLLARVREANHPRR
ncbi:hypothetical protein [Kitasatospora sp. MBT66]|uniref:hypothetical protein n=1 Tax=Kitasatospora sp. MBT66 TaxID=1444769 RepID=UPI0005BA9067|nr:hypothetical protein [Kitasatospora sp. MBT66]